MTYVRLLPANEAGLASGIVFGDKGAINKEFYQQLINSGMVHIVVASGYNVMLVAGAVMSGLFWLVRRGKALALAIGAMWFYALLAGGDPSVVRASIMVSVLLIGQSLGRQGTAWWSLFMAGWLMVLIEPFIVESVSFQLSMAASVGLMVVYPTLMRILDGKHVVEWLDKSGTMTTVSTMVTTAPIIWWHFARMNPAALISNVLVLPLVPMIMVLGALTLVFGGISAPFLYAFTHWISVVAYWF